MQKYHYYKEQWYIRLLMLNYYSFEHNCKSG